MRSLAGNRGRRLCRCREVVEIGLALCCLLIFMMDLSLLHFDISLSLRVSEFQMNLTLCYKFVQ